jgi:hypothetical protein
MGRQSTMLCARALATVQNAPTTNVYDRQQGSVLHRSTIVFTRAEGRRTAAHTAEMYYNIVARVLHIKPQELTHGLPCGRSHNKDVPQHCGGCTAPAKMPNHNNSPMDCRLAASTKIMTIGPRCHPDPHTAKSFYLRTSTNTMHKSLPSQTQRIYSTKLVSLVLYTDLRNILDH